MTPMDEPGRWVGLALLSGWAAVDTTEAAQLMICQPLAAGCLAGLVCGQPALGLFLGAALQTLWSRLAPVGATSMPDVGPGTVAGVAVAAWLAPPDLNWRPELRAFFPPPQLALAVLAGFFTALMTARASQGLVVWARRGNARLVRWADAAAIRGDWGGVERANLTGALQAFARGALTLPLVLLACFSVAMLATRLVPSRPLGGGPGAATGGVGGLDGFATNPGPVLFWWFGVAALLTTLWRGKRGDWLWLAGGLAGGGALTLVLR